jgi:hypothetical protein
MEKIDKYINVELINNFIDNELANILLEKCNCLFTAKDYRTCHVFGDDDLIYKTTYYTNQKSRTTYTETNAWIILPELLIVKEQLEKYTGDIYNFCAIMIYADETVVIKKHRDKEIPSGSTICGISLGATRRMQITHYQDNKIMELNHASMYRLLAPTNDFCLHEILPETKRCGIRYSLTFRSIPNAMSKNDIKYCSASLKSGKRKGEACGKIVYNESDYCGIHNK